MRFAIPLTVLPPVVGIVVAAILWGQHAEPEFFSAATHVLAIGAVGMALTGNFFRLSLHRERRGGTYAIFNVMFVLVAAGFGLGFAFGALARGHSRAPDLAITAGALAAGIAAFAVQALFGTPGLRPEGAADDPDT